MQQPAATGSQAAVAKPAVAQPAVTQPTVGKPAAGTQPAVAKPAAGRRLAGAFELPIAHAAEQPAWQPSVEQSEAWWEGPEALQSGRRLAGMAGAGALPQHAQQEAQQAQLEAQQEQGLALQRSGRRLLLTPGIKPLVLPTCDFGP